ncbi:hypothetical protein V6Z77_006004 [Aspergillus fumigatus]
MDQFDFEGYHGAVALVLQVPGRAGQTPQPALVLPHLGVAVEALALPPRVQESRSADLGPLVMLARSATQVPRLTAAVSPPAAPGAAPWQALV